MSSQYKASPEGWYSPLVREEKQPEPPAKKRGPSVWRILLGLALALGLITASSLYFSDGTQKTVAWRMPAMPMPTPRGDTPAGPFGNILPELPDPETEFPEDWKSYFDSYFVIEDNTVEESRVPRVESAPDFTLKLETPAEEELSLQEIYRNTVDSIVAIKSFKDGSIGYYWGSGIVMSEDGLILTNAHLVEGCDSATVALADNESYDALLVGVDSASDIAILKIEAEGLKAAEFGDSDALTVGEEVVAIGNPLSEEFRATMTNGIVSAISRGVNYNGRTMNLIQTNAAINEGNSGGALLNRCGQVIGVTNMKMMSVYSSIEGIGFAIPSATVREIANSLILYGEVRGRTAIGITVGAVNTTASEHYELPEGLYVSAVSKGSDAEKKGIKEGDIITAVNGNPVKSTEDILEAKKDLSVGDSLTFTVWRDGETFDVDVLLIDHNDVY